MPYKDWIQVQTMEAHLMKIFQVLPLEVSVVGIIQLVGLRMTISLAKRLNQGGSHFIAKGSETIHETNR